MTASEWLAVARAHADALVELIERYHPVRQVRTGRRMADLYDVQQVAPHDGPMPITAPSAERAAEQVRQGIRQNFEGDPVAAFRVALAAGDIARLMTLLNDAWFGVPESTSCWRIHGFREAVDLLDDPPDDEVPDGERT